MTSIWILLEEWHFEITTMQSGMQEMIIEIDADVEALIRDINATPNGQQQTDFIDSFQKMMIDQLMGPFGLTAAMFEDRDGGAITSLHNFGKGVVANDADEKRHAGWQEAQKESFQRKDYDAAMDAAHSDMSSADGKFYDAYKEPETEFAEGPRMTARDHVTSASEIERSTRGHLAQTREERVATATQKENVVLTSFNMNSSKQESDLKVWAAGKNSQDPSKTNAEYYDLDPKAIDTAYEKSKKAVDGVQKKAVFDKQMGELLIEGSAAAGKLVLRQVLGLLLKDLIEGLIQDVRYLVKEGFEGAKSLLTLAEERIKSTYEKIKLKWAEYLKEGVSTGLTGFLSNLITLVINSFITTAKNVVRMLREAILSIVRAIKVIVSPQKGMARGDIAMEVLKILSGTVVLCLGIALEEIIQKALEAVPLLLPFAATLAPVITGVITGALTLFTVLAFDRLKSGIAFRNKALADTHRGQQVNLLRVKQTVVLIDRAYSHMIVSTQVMRAQFESDWLEVQDTKVVTQNRLNDYRNSVNSLDDLLELF